MYLNIRTVCVLEPFHTNITLTWDWRSKSHIFEETQTKYCCEKCVFFTKYFASCVSLSVSSGTNQPCWLPATAKKRRKSFSAPICTNKAGRMVGSYAPSMTTTHTETLLWLILGTQTRQWTHHWEDMKMKMNSKTTRTPFHLEKIEKTYCNFKKGCALRGDILHKQHCGNDTDTQTHSEHINRMTALFAGRTLHFFLTEPVSIEISVHAAVF